MKQPVYLKRFEYSIPASEKNFNGRGNLHTDFLEMDFQPVKVNIDFANKSLFLEGNKIRAKSFSSKKEFTGFHFEKERIMVNANIY